MTRRRAARERRWFEMISRRRMLQMSVAGAMLATAGGQRVGAAEPAPSSAAGTIQAFYDALVAVMKDGPSLGFAGRRDRLQPAVERAFDLPRMTQVAVGLRWNDLTPRQRQELIAAFTAYSAATYASRFTKFAGERFEVAAKTSATPEGVIVHTKLVPGGGDDPVRLDYLMRQADGQWKIEDVYLSGTISELATRRSEFTSVLARGGPQALVDILRKKAEDQHG
jgi:phospholipid transport system substrate-binding protein